MDQFAENSAKSIHRGFHAHFAFSAIFTGTICYKIMHNRLDFFFDNKPKKDSNSFDHNAVYTLEKLILQNAALNCL